MHAGRCDNLLVLLAVRGKGYAAMEKDLKVGPDFVDVLLAGELEHAHQHRHHPAGHARKVGDILVHRLAGDEVALHLKVGQQRRLLLGHSHEVDQRIDILYQYGGEVAHERAAEIVVGRVAASEYQALAVE